MCDWASGMLNHSLHNAFDTGTQFGCSLLCTLTRAFALSAAALSVKQCERFLHLSPVVVIVWLFFLRSPLIDAASADCAAWWQLCDLFGTFSMKIICGSRAYWKANNYSCFFFFFFSARGVTLAKLHVYMYVYIQRVQLCNQSQDNVHRTKAAVMLIRNVN